MVNHHEKPLLGIDLGTTNFRASLSLKGEVINPNIVLPAYVGFAGPDRLLGESARACAVALPPKNTIFEPKRALGRRSNPLESDLGRFIKDWPFQLAEENGELRYEIEGRMVSPVEVTALLLRALKERAEEFVGAEVKEAVIAIPSEWNHSQKIGVMEAGRSAGLNVLNLLDEVNATALTYVKDKRWKGQRNLVICDWGGGNLNLSVVGISLDKNGQQIEVKASSSDSNFGGIELDKRMLKYFCDQFRRQNRADLTSNPRAIARLAATCEKIKIALSSQIEFSILLENLYRGLDFNARMSREIFEDLSRDIFEIRPLQMTNRVLEEAGISREQIHEVLMVGGTSNIPKVVQVFGNYFQGKEINMLLKESSVCIGAAIHAELYCQDEHKWTEEFSKIAIMDTA